jgi:hypothetical protein
MTDTTRSWTEVFREGIVDVVREAEALLEAGNRCGRLRVFQSN